MGKPDSHLSQIEEEILLVNEQLHGIDYTLRTYQDRKKAGEETIRKAKYWLEKLETVHKDAPRRREVLLKRLDDLRNRRVSPKFNPKVAKMMSLLRSLRKAGATDEAIAQLLENSDASS